MPPVGAMPPRGPSPAHPPPLNLSPSPTKMAAPQEDLQASPERVGMFRATMYEVKQGSDASDGSGRDGRRRKGRRRKGRHSSSGSDSSEESSGESRSRERKRKHKRRNKSSSPEGGSKRRGKRSRKAKYSSSDEPSARGSAKKKRRHREKSEEGSSAASAFRQFGGAGHHMLKVSTGQHALDQAWITRMVNYFQIMCQPIKQQDGGWLIECANSGLAMYLLANLNNLRLIDMCITVTLEEGAKDKTILDEDSKDVYMKILEYFRSEYNNAMTPHLKESISMETEANFFERSWEDVYTADLSNTFRLTANAVRSLCFIRNPAMSIPTTKIMVVTADDSLVAQFGYILDPVLRVTNTKLLAITNPRQIDPYCEAVVGTPAHLLAVGETLVLHELRALVIDNASALCANPHHASALARLVSLLRTVAANYDEVNRVAVVPKIDLKELSEAETVLCCRFTRTNLKQHFKGGADAPACPPPPPHGY